MVVMKIGRWSRITIVGREITDILEFVLLSEFPSILIGYKDLRYSARTQRF